MRKLCNGGLPLSRAFWEFTILYGFLAGLAASGTALAALAAGLPAAYAVVAHLLPLPYLCIAVTGVRRSAGSYAGPAFWARSAEAGAVFWAGMMLML